MPSRRRVSALLAVSVAAAAVTAVPAAGQPSDTAPTVNKPALVAEGAGAPSRLSLPTLNLGALDTFALTFPADADAHHYAWQVLGRDVPSDWEARHNEELGRRRAGKATTVAGWTAYGAGMAMVWTELLTNKQQKYCSSFYSTSICLLYRNTNKSLAAGGWFTVAAGSIVLGTGMSKGQAAGAELAALEAERLGVNREPVAATGTGLNSADPWKRVSDLQPGQFVRLDVVKGQGRNASGWFVEADDQKVTLHDGKQVLAIDKDSIRRVRAVPLGRERSVPTGFAISMAGIAGSVGAMFALLPQGELFGTTDIIGDKDLTGKQAVPLICVMGASTVAGVIMMNKGKPKTIYDANAKAAPRRSTSSDGVMTAPGDGSSWARSEKGIAIMTPPKGVGVAFVARW